MCASNVIHQVNDKPCNGFLSPDTERPPPRWAPRPEVGRTGSRFHGVRIEPIGWETDAIAPRLGFGWNVLPQTKSLGLREIAALRQTHFAICTVVESVPTKNTSSVRHESPSRRARREGGLESGTSKGIGQCFAFGRSRLLPSHLHHRPKPSPSPPRDISITVLVIR